MAQSTKHPLFSTINLEREIEAEFRNRPPVREVQPADVAPPTPALLMPDHVEHRDGATKIGSYRRRPLFANTNLRQGKSRPSRRIDALGQPNVWPSHNSVVRLRTYHPCIARSALHFADVDKRLAEELDKGHFIL